MSYKFQMARVLKTINAPIKFVYNWCTDFSEGDPKLTGSTRKRVIMDKTSKRAVYVSMSAEGSGSTPISVYFVKLKPPNAWHLDMYNPDRTETAEYRLKPLPKSKTQIRIDFKSSWKHPEKSESDDELAKRMNEHWEKYVKALEEEYSRARQ